MGVLAKATALRLLIAYLASLFAIRPLPLWKSDLLLTFGLHIPNLIMKLLPFSHQTATNSFEFWQDFFFSPARKNPKTGKEQALPVRLGQQQDGAL